MTISTTLTKSGIKTAISTDEVVRFVGKWAILTKIGWAIIVLVIGLSVILGLPYGYRILTETCTTNCYIYGQLSPTNFQDLQKLGLSLETYALVYCGIFVIFSLVCLGTSGLIIWKKPGQFMPFCAAIFILGLITVEGSFVFYGRLFQDYPWLGIAMNLRGLFPFYAYLFLAFPSGKFKSGFLLWLFFSLALTDFCIQSYTMFFEPLNFQTSDTNKLIISLATTLILCGMGFLLELRKKRGQHKPQKYLVYFPICFVAVALTNVILIFGLFVVFAALFYRYFKVLTPHERNAAKWLIYGFMIWILTLVTLLVLPLFFPFLNAPGSYYFLFGSTFGFFGCATNLAGLLMAVLYANAFDIDLIINRTLVFTLLTGCVVGLYTLVVLGARQLLGFGETNLIVSLLATGLIVVLFQPLRTGLQGTVNRLLFGKRNEPYSVLTGLGQRLETTIYQPEAILPELLNSIATALKLPYVAIKLTGQERIVSEASTYTNISELSRLPATPVNFALSYQGETVGALLVSPRRGEERLAERDLRLLKDLARQIGVVAYSLKLLEDLRQTNTELKTANLDLQRARERLVLAREEERRKLRRDLHDDLAPSLAGLALSADALTGLIERDPIQASLKSQQLYAAIRHSVGDIRRLAHELRPPILDEFGLVAALQERTQQFSTGNLLVKLEASPGLPPLPAAVEVATYRVAQEALMNVVRHAVARHCIIRLLYSSEENKLAFKNMVSLTLEISDDGQGLPANRHSLTSGVGLRSMREQAEELGGTFTVENQPSGGTLACLILSFEGN
jgi:signal transduction histidine kinase